jgi:hypothetical protein
MSAWRTDEPGDEDFAKYGRTSGNDTGNMPKKSQGDMRVESAQGRLSGDWAWKPPAVQDPGYVYTAEQLAAINATDDPLAAARAMPARPWSVAAFKPNLEHIHARK